MPNKERSIRFPYNKEKAIQSVLRLLHRNGGSMDKLKLIKLIFFADREHVVRFGRPIVGGDYYAMKLGPVSSDLRDDVDKSASTEEYPFEIRGDYNLIAKEACDEDWLSESDLEILDEVYSKFGHIDSVKLGLFSHNFKAWKNNEPPEEGRKFIPYEDFFEDNEDKTMMEVIMDDQDARDC